MADKTLGPKEAQLRAQREARIEHNKRLMETTAVKAKGKVIGRVVKFKAKKPGGRGR
jgi:hypothetical protein